MQLPIKISPPAYFLFDNLKNGRKKLVKREDGFYFNDKLLDKDKNKFLLQTIQELIDKNLIGFKLNNGIFGKRGELVVARISVEKEDINKKEGA